MSSNIYVNGGNAAAGLGRVLENLRTRKNILIVYLNTKQLSV